MKVILIILTAYINSIWTFGISWGRSNSTKRMKRSIVEYNLSYQEFLKQAEEWLGSNEIINKAKKRPCYNNIGECFKIEAEVSGRSKSNKKIQGGKTNDLTKEEIDLYNLLVYSEPDYKKVEEYWDNGVEKIIINTYEPIKCEFVYFPVETIGMTMASDGSVSKSETKSESDSHTWKIGGKVKAETSKLSPTGSISLTVSPYYSNAHSNVIKEVTKETFSNKYPSSCTPSLINAGLLCHPVKVFRTFIKGETILENKYYEIPEALVPNRNKELFDKYTNCIDYLRDENDFIF